MSDLRSALEARWREFEPPPDGLSRLHGLRRRRRRNQRVTAAVVALAMAGVATYALTRAFRVEPDRRVPTSPAITPETVGALRPAWADVLTRESSAAVVAAGDRIYVDMGHSGLAAYRSTCAGLRCPPEWTGPVGVSGGSGSNSSPAVVAGSRIFVTTDRLEAFAADCAESTRRCAPVVVEHPPVLNAELSAPTLRDGVVYVGTQDGRLLAYRADCLVSSGCGPIWSAVTGGSLANSAPAVDGELVYGLSDRLYAFPVSCAGTATCAPRWVGEVGDIFTAPVASGGMVYVSHEDRLYAFSARCGSNGGTCAPAWTFRDPAGAALSTPATDGGLVFVAGSSLFALDPGCSGGGGSCAPVWAGDIGPGGANAPPAVGDGLVFVSTNRLMAFAQTCSGSTCRPLWQSEAFPTQLTRAAIGQRYVAVTDSDGRLTVFEVRSPG